MGEIENRAKSKLYASDRSFAGSLEFRTAAILRLGIVASIPPAVFGAGRLCDLA